MSLFNFKYHTERAEDILTNKDPVVYAGSIVMRGLTLPLIVEENGKQNNDQKSSAFLAIRPERTIESQFHQRELLEESKKKFKTQYYCSEETREQGEDDEDEFVAEALSRGFSIRRQREQKQQEKNLDDELQQQNSKKKNNISHSNNKPTTKKTVVQKQKPSENNNKIQIPGTLAHHILLTPHEMQKLQSSITTYHQPSTSRSDSKSLYEKLFERLSNQRVRFVNDLIQRRKVERDKKKAEEDEEQKQEKERK